MISPNLSNYNMLGPLPVLPSACSGGGQGDIDRLVHRITEMGGEMVSAGDNSGDLPPPLQSKPNLRNGSEGPTSPLLSKPNLRNSSEGPTPTPSLLSKPNLRALMVSLGEHGFVIVRRAKRGSENEPLLAQVPQTLDPVVGLHFAPPATGNSNIVSVSGAGDCLASGFLYGVVSGLSINACAALANATAAASLQSIATVPASIAAIHQLEPPALEPLAIHVLS